MRRAALAALLAWTGAAHAAVHGSSGVGTIGPPGGGGLNGISPTLQLGTISTGVPGSSASVTDSGTPPNHVLNFIIPAGTNYTDLCSRQKVTTALNGTVDQFTATYSAKGFTAPPVVTATAESPGTTAAQSYIAFPWAPTTTSVSGHVMEGTTLAALGATLVPAPAGIIVDVTACPAN